jgi:hypothetical protein
MRSRERPLREPRRGTRDLDSRRAKYCGDDAGVRIAADQSCAPSYEKPSTTFYDNVLSLCVIFVPISRERSRAIVPIFLASDTKP